MKCFLLVLGFVLACHYGKGQIIISLIFGDKLNNEKVEFGLDGGLTYSDIQGLGESNAMAGFNLGFYFDIKTKNPRWMINTGVIVRSPMGARNLPVYSLNNPDLDNLFKNGSVTRNLRYFHLPVMMKYLFRNNIYVKAGTQVGLLAKGFDIFYQSVNADRDLQFEVRNRSNYTRFDAGLALGLGYRLMHGHGMNIGVHYYWGLVDFTLDDSGPGNYHRALYATVGIPIGKAASEKKK